MPTSKEFAIRMEDRPGTLGKVCRALADRGVNILAFQSFPSGEKSQVCIVVDNPKIAKTVLDDEDLDYTEAEVAQVKPTSTSITPTAGSSRVRTHRC